MSLSAEQLLALIEQGPIRDLDLSGGQYSGLKFDGLRADGLNLRGADLSACDLSDAVLVDCQFQGRA